MEVIYKYIKNRWARRAILVAIYPLICLVSLLLAVGEAAFEEVEDWPEIFKTFWDDA